MSTSVGCPPTRRVFQNPSSGNKVVPSYHNKLLKRKMMLMNSRDLNQRLTENLNCAGGPHEFVVQDKYQYLDLRGNNRCWANTIETYCFPSWRLSYRRIIKFGYPRLVCRSASKTQWTLNMLWAMLELSWLDLHQTWYGFAGTSMNVWKIQDECYQFCFVVCWWGHVKQVRRESEEADRQWEALQAQKSEALRCQLLRRQLETAANIRDGTVLQNCTSPYKGGVPVRGRFRTYF